LPYNMAVRTASIDKMSKLRHCQPIYKDDIRWHEYGTWKTTV